MLLLSGARDMVVPPSHMKTLWEISRKRGCSASLPVQSENNSDLEKDQFYVFPDGEHGKLDSPFVPSFWLICISGYVDSGRILGKD